MAVQAQYHHHHPFLARGEQQESKEAAMELPAPQQAPPLFLDFSNGDGGGGGDMRKRLREAEAAAQHVGHFSLQPQAQKVISVAQLQKRPANAAAARALRLDFDEQSEHISSTTSSSLLSDELAAQFGSHKREMDQFLQEHEDRLRRALADARTRHYRALLGAAEAAAARRMREKEAEAGQAARRTAKLEEQLARLRAESAAWQAKALAEQAAAAALHAQLQQAAAAAQARGKAEEEEGGLAPADDAESGFVDPDRVEVVAPAPAPARPCRSCGLRPATVVLLPCRHLCVCGTCEAGASGPVACACPVCRCPVTGTVQVFFS